MTTVSRFDGPIWSDDRTIKARELMDQRGANLLANSIRAYWRKHGHDVQTRIEIASGARSDRGYVYCVRSDMIGGLPR